jgi:hypothetical protein
MARAISLGCVILLSGLGIVLAPNAAADPGPACVQVDDGWWYCVVSIDGGNICVVHQEMYVPPYTTSGCAASVEQRDGDTYLCIRQTCVNLTDITG